MIGIAIVWWFGTERNREFFFHELMYSLFNTHIHLKSTQYSDRHGCLWSRYFQNEKNLFLTLHKSFNCSYTSAELEAFLQHITIMMNRRSRINAPEAEAQIMTASSHVITLSVQRVPSYRKNSSSVHLTKETEFVWMLFIEMTEYTTSKNCMFTCRC